MIREIVRNSADINVSAQLERDKEIANLKKTADKLKAENNKLKKEVQDLKKALAAYEGSNP